MKVILQKDVPHLGDAGEIKEVAGGYARNFLIPRKLVIPALTGSTKALNHQKLIIQKKVEKRKVEMSALSQSLKALGAVEIQVRVGVKNKLFGSVTTLQISNALREKGYSIDKRKIEIMDRIRALGDFNVKLKLAEGIEVPLALKVVPDKASIEAIEEETYSVRDESSNKAREAEAEGSAEDLESASEETEAAERSEGE